MREALVRTALVAAVMMGILAAPAAAETLGAKNVVTGSSTAYVDVDLPRETKVVFDSPVPGEISFDVQGGGRFAGVALYQLGRSEYPAIAMAGRFDPSLTCVAGDCPELITAAGQSTGEQLAWDPSEATLAPGRYRLFVVSDGTPVKATIRLPGLEGERTFTPTAPAFPHTVAGLDRIDPFPMDHFDVFAGKAHLDAHGVILMSARVHTTENTGQVEFEVCNYDQTEPSTTDFYPGCGQNNEHALYYGHTYIDAYKPIITDWVFELPKGEWRTGGNVTVLGNITSSAWAALWLPTDGPPAPGGAAPAATAPGTAGAPAPPQAAPAPASAGGRVTVTKARRRGRTLALSLRCAGGPCTGSVALGRSKMAYELAAGTTGTVTLRGAKVRRGRATVKLAEAGRAARRVTVRVR